MFQVNLGAINKGMTPTQPDQPQAPGGGGGGWSSYPYMPAGGYYTPPPAAAPPIVQPQHMPPPLPLPPTPGTPPVPDPGQPSPPPVSLTCPDGFVMTAQGCVQANGAGTTIIMPPIAVDNGLLTGDYAIGSSSIPKWLVIGLGLSILLGVGAYIVHARKAKPSG
jgi:hypothetical protein